MQSDPPGTGVLVASGGTWPGRRVWPHVAGPRIWAAWGPPPTEHRLLHRCGQAFCPGSLRSGTAAQGGLRTAPTSPEGGTAGAGPWVGGATASAPRPHGEPRLSSSPSPAPSPVVPPSAGSPVQAPAVAPAPPGSLRGGDRPCRGSWWSSAPAHAFLSRRCCLQRPLGRSRQRRVGLARPGPESAPPGAGTRGRDLPA